MSYPGLIPAEREFLEKQGDRSTMDNTHFLDQLGGAVEKLLERHLSTAKEWFPHEFVPWERAADLVDQEDFDPASFPLPDGVREALVVNLLTEDNLPYYFCAIDRFFGPDHAWGEWARRWTAEEGRHALTIRDYLTVSRAVDPYALERGRMQQMSHGFHPTMSGPAECLVYVTLQELATRIAHRNTGNLLGDQPGYAVMARVAADENLHHLFYRDLGSHAVELDPSGMVLAMEREVRTFQMPGAGIEGFVTASHAIARAGIYDLAIHHDQVVMPVLRHWRLEELEGLTPDADKARDTMVRHLGRLERAGHHLAERRAEMAPVGT